MKRNINRIFFCVFCAFLWLFPVSAPAQAPQPSISAVIEADRERIFQRETFRLTLSVYSAGVRLGKNMELLSLPDENRLQRLGDFKELPLKRSRTHETRRFRCEARAISPRVITLSPVLRVGILVKRRAFIGYRWEERARDIRVKPLALSISPLPELGQPENFSGAVGQFAFDVDVTPSDVAVGDLITAVMKIRGTGYLEEISPPRVSPGRHFKVYNPKPSSGRNKGEKIFEQILIPQSTNAVRISSVSFSFFDPRAGTYKTITRGPFSLTFHPPKSAAPEKPYRPAVSTPADSDGKTGFRTARFLSSSGFFGHPQAIVTKNETARFAPASSAVASFELPEGSVVRVIEISRNWAKISFGNKRGWMPASALSREF